MSLTGILNKLGKTNQLIGEKIGYAKGTKIDVDFQMLEKKTDRIENYIDDVAEKTKHFLQPNPAYRAKLWMNNLPKIKSTKNIKPYPQPEGELGESMIKHGTTLGLDNNFGQSLIYMGDSLRKLAEIKFELEDNLKEQFLDPLEQVKDDKLKRISHLRKKTEDKRLEFDAKNRKQPPPDDIKLSEEKFLDYKGQAQVAMSDFINNEFEKMDNLIEFAKQLSKYHMQCNQILIETIAHLNERKKKLQVQGIKHKYRTSTPMVSSPSW